MSGKPYDTLHDYRPDPEFAVKSHLYDGIDSSFDESGLFSDELEDIVSKGEGLLDDYHDRFYKEFLSGIGAEYPEPLSKLEEGEGEGEDEDAPEWADMKPEERIAVIRKMSWNELIRNLAEGLKDGKETFPDKEPEVDGDWYVKEKYINFFPHLEVICRKLPDYFMIRGYFLNQKPARTRSGPKYLADMVQGTDREKAKEEVRPIGKKIMWGIIAFRNAYLNFMFKILRDGGLKITHKTDGAIGIASGYDVTFGGADDVAAACEFLRAFRAEWRAECSSLFDAKLHCRGWMTVEDSTLHPSEGTDKDKSLQVLTLDFIGDIYGLVKIRRYSSKVEWAAFCNSVMREINVDGLEKAVPDENAETNICIYENSGLPLFKRFDFADDIYGKQYVRPMLERTKDVHAAFVKSPMGERLKSEGKDIEKATPRTLERLFEYDRDKMLRAMTIAYMELMAKARLLEKRLKESEPGSFRWYQHDATSDGLGELKEYTEINPDGTGLSAEGMMLFLEKSSLLMSEAALFAIEAYFTQGAVWSAVGVGQSGLTELTPSVYQRMQCFNEQVGDGLKELREYLREIQQHEIETMEKIIMDEGSKALNEAAPEEYDEVFNAYQEEMDDLNEAKEAAGEERNEMEFYRTSKYETRMGEELKAMIENLEEDEMIKERGETYQYLYPDLTHPDDIDLDALKQELKIAESFQKNINELLHIRKGRKSPETEKDYGGMSYEEKIDAVNKLIEEMIKEGGDFNELAHGGMRSDSEIRYSEASPRGNRNKYYPQATFDEEGGVWGVWGLRHLIHHLLWHAATVNKRMRSLLSRGPLEITVKNFAAG